ncbi:chaperone modulator CbpM [Rhodoferax sediminis]|jgi:chaperone modulatory protein CbpM|uniref:MerR family transcriptional regulator n=1 Tax=Rhodoferax sediminis TaxID=2509614 RepID=A0A515DC14_9BURK|nr:chaperone modulator CbpM [Rhodoferax sediminis]QDL37961.1 MerR family transcriptional regulator [Rhodoferax sediminis]
MSPNTTQSQATVFILEEQTGLTLAELCRACMAQTGFIAELVEEGVLTPAGQAPDQWRFTGVQVRHASVAVHLQRDLGVNVAGAALALQLLDELEALRARLRAAGAA